MEVHMKASSVVPLQKREYRDLSYGTESPNQKLDLFLPEEGEGPFPLVVFIHGGAWMMGDKADGQEYAFKELTRYGFAVASINHRLLGEAYYPAGLTDCSSALSYLYDHSSLYHLDPDKFSIAGASSGGHYALLTALQEENKVPLRCVIAWYPVTDMEHLLRSINNGKALSQDELLERAGINLDPDDPDTEEFFYSASPVHFVSKDMLPVLIQHGTADPVVPIEESISFVESANALNPISPVVLEAFPGEGHGGYGFETEENILRLVRFLKKMECKKTG